MTRKTTRKPTSDQILVRWYLELYDSTLTGWELEDLMTEWLIKRGVPARRARTSVRRFLNS